MLPNKKAALPEGKAVKFLTLNYLGEIGNNKLIISVKLLSIAY